MNILYTSVQCSERSFFTLFQNKKNIPGQQAQKYNRLLAEGLSLCKRTKVYALTALPVTPQNCRKLYLNAKDERIEFLHYHYLSVVNVHRIKDILTLFSAFFYTLKCIPHCKIDCIIMDVLASPAALGSYCAAKLLKKKAIAVVTDVPDILFSHGDKAYHIVSNYLINRADGYVFLTQQMDEYINKKNKPYVIVEGIVDCDTKVSRRSETNEDTLEKRIVLYSGTIHKKYGIKALIEGFIDAQLDNTELHIYGAGDYQADLIEVCKQYNNIKYFGCVLNSEMVCLQKKATILINPRSPKEEFTKYSFPSKNMEYLLSGVPVMAALLPGMPEEYGEYMYVIEDCSREGICNALKKVLSKTSKELCGKGRDAQQFVLREKNKKVQAEKIVKAFGDL